MNHKEAVNFFYETIVTHHLLDIAAYVHPFELPVQILYCFFKFGCEFFIDVPCLRMTAAVRSVSRQHSCTVTDNPIFQMFHRQSIFLPFPKAALLLH